MVPAFVKNFLHTGERVRKTVSASMAEQENCRLVLTDKRLLITSDNFFGRGTIFHELDYLDIRGWQVENPDHTSCTLLLKTTAGPIGVSITQSHINEIQNIINDRCGGKFRIEQIPINRRLASNKWSTVTLLFIFLLTMPFITEKIQNRGYFNQEPDRPALTEAQRQAAYREWSAKIKEYWNSRENETGIVTDIKMYEETNAVRVNVNMQDLDENNAGRLAEFISGNFRLNFQDRALILNIYSPYPHIILTRVYNTAGVKNT
ncbi:PH domain-containing protein [Desulfoscipio geothermicus]|uniref:PH domain-containing protein n=1 Tax=Desulfoscipio geothermicus DSM 3669 TaxID=1121426 RepID=A0A1I6CN24_9FIRM|nr:PH domain-containing protein [Desulfoscipio geothermicus]SFQ94579.1 PH domain-containing protein [Desulfoscipio geothermicus DSM 3669]